MKSIYAKSSITKVVRLMLILEEVLPALVGQAPWAALVLTILYYAYKGLRKEIGDLKGIVISLQLFLVDFMRLKGLFTLEEAGFIKKEVKRIARVQDPLTPEEVEKLRKVLSKDVDEIELEEIGELVEYFANKWMKEGGRLSFDIFLRLAMLKGYVESKKLKEGV